MLIGVATLDRRNMIEVAVEGQFEEMMDTPRFPVEALDIYTPVMMRDSKGQIYSTLYSWFRLTIMQGLLPFLWTRLIP